MARERKLDPERKDANPVIGFVFGRPDEESRFAQIGPLRKAHHLRIAERINADHDRERVAP